MTNMSHLAKQTSKIIYHNIPHTPSKVGVVARKTFSHTPDEAMSDGLVKAFGLGKMYSVEKKISYFKTFQSPKHPYQTHYQPEDQCLCKIGMI